MTSKDTRANRTLDFFESQFRRQVRERDLALNPFEQLALGYLRGVVLDLGAGLGNLSLEAGRRGHRVVAVEASPTAVARINRDAHREGLEVTAITADLTHWRINRSYDTVIAIGLLMFFPRATALQLLRNIQDQVTPGGRAIVNTLIEGTSYTDMFHGNNYYLFRSDELLQSFPGWNILDSVQHSYPAPGDTLKAFSTIIAEKST